MADPISSGQSLSPRTFSFEYAGTPGSKGGNTTLIIGIIVLFFICCYSLLSSSLSLGGGAYYYNESKTAETFEDTPRYRGTLGI